MSNQAYAEYQRIRHATAFNVSEKAKRRNVNQHLRTYTFPDGSVLEIYRNGRALVPHLVVGTLRTNAFGK